MSDPSAPAPLTVDATVPVKIDDEAPVPPPTAVAPEEANPATVPVPETETATASPLLVNDTLMTDANAVSPVAPPPAPLQIKIENEDGSSEVAPAPVSDSVPAMETEMSTSTVPPGVQIVLPLEEFAEDLDLRLGRANGNIYQRRAGIEGVHDGQVMVRLKKKRFIVIDYGIVPNELDLQAAAMSPNINVPLGGGVTKCTGKVASEPGGPLVPCKKIGMPVLLYDSEPDQPPSLYLRSGLCFTCQRNLNEKRRTQRKRPADRANHQAAAKVTANAQQSQAAFLAAQKEGFSLGGPVPLPGATTNLPGMQTVRIGGIGSQTSLVGAGTTGRVNATPHHRVLMAVTNGHKKIKLAHTNQPLILAPDAIILNGPPDNHSCKSVRAGHGFAEIGADLNVEVHQSLQSAQALLHSVNTPEMIQQGIPPPTPDDISRTYDQAFYSLSKSLYLLVQWKTSWDAAIASAMQQEVHNTVASQNSQVVVNVAVPPHAQVHLQQQQNSAAAAALQAVSMANAAATAAIGGMINGVPGSVPVGIPGVPVCATPNGHGLPVPVGVNVGVGGHGMGMPVPVQGHGHGHPQEPTLAQAVASAAAVAAVSQPEGTRVASPKEAATAGPLDQSVEV